MPKKRRRPQRITFEGDYAAAAKWLPFAKKKLRQMDRLRRLTKVLRGLKNIDKGAKRILLNRLAHKRRRARRLRYLLPDGYMHVKSIGNIDFIRIVVEGAAHYSVLGFQTPFDENDESVVTYIVYLIQDIIRDEDKTDEELLAKTKSFVYLTYTQHLFSDPERPDVEDHPHLYVFKPYVLRTPYMVPFRLRPMTHTMLKGAEKIEDLKFRAHLFKTTGSLSRKQMKSVVRSNRSATTLEVNGDNGIEYSADLKQLAPEFAGAGYSFMLSPGGRDDADEETPVHLTIASTSRRYEYTFYDPLESGVVHRPLFTVLNSTSLAVLYEEEYWADLDPPPHEPGGTPGGRDSLYFRLYMVTPTQAVGLGLPYHKPGSNGGEPFIGVATVTAESIEITRYTYHTLTDVLRYHDAYHDLGDYGDFNFGMINKGYSFGNGELMVVGLYPYAYGSLRDRVLAIRINVDGDLLGTDYVVDEPGIRDHETGVFTLLIEAGAVYHTGCMLRWEYHASGLTNLLRTTDSGATWSYVAPPIENMILAQASHLQVIKRGELDARITGTFLLDGVYWVYLSEDSGATWVQGAPIVEYPYPPGPTNPMYNHAYLGGNIRGNLYDHGIVEPVITE